MVYRNKRNGNVINIPCILFGEDWEDITPSKSPAKKAVKKKNDAVCNDK